MGGDGCKIGVGVEWGSDLYNGGILNWPILSPDPTPGEALILDWMSFLIPSWQTLESGRR